MSANTSARPGSVTAVVVLTWIVAVLTVVSGIALLLLSDNVLKEAGITKSTAATYGWVEIVLGVVVALVAVGLSRGSNAARILVSIVMVLRVAAAVWIALAVSTSARGTAIAAGVVAVIILALLWTRRANDYFAQ